MQCIILGTRPDIIKLSPIIKEYEERKLPYFVVHTGQHYDLNMSSDLFAELHLPEPKYNLKCTNVSDMITGIGSVLNHEKPRSVMVLGDTMSALAGALATNRQTRITGNTNQSLTKIPLIHVEAGLRSFDIEMAEEVNRMIIDHLSTILFCPTDIAKTNLVNENVGGKMFVVGNTIADVVTGKATYDGYVLATLHRAENVDNSYRLRTILDGLEELDKIVYFPVHPRTQKRMSELKPLFESKNVKAMPPVGYEKMMDLLRGASVVVTDSGGIQEEACILKVPCVTIRDTTERPETVQLLANIVVGTESVDIVKGVEAVWHRRNWEQPYGEHVAERIVDKCQELLG
jgi:UDP-N-acetylglucosamine 2-epimerase (non-hydrolysing)